jgi:hypothetical protein
VTSDLEISEFTQRRILAACEQGLQRAGVVGALPTPLEEVARVAGVQSIVDMRYIPGELEMRKPRIWTRILGALQFGAPTIFVDREQVGARARFTTAHEIGHLVLPWHEQVHRLDNEGILFEDAAGLIDREANLAAAHLIFQGRQFFEQALSYQASMGAPLTLAGPHGASIHATLRHYVEYHPDPVALYVAGRYQTVDHTLPIWRSLESPSFRQRFGHLLDRVPERKLAAVPADKPSLGMIVNAAFASDEIPSMTVRIIDLNGEACSYTAEAYYNRTNMFVLFTPRAVIKLGRRVDVKVR